MKNDEPRKKKRTKDKEKRQNWPHWVISSSFLLRSGPRLDLARDVK
jgi:hypothetical protein